MFSFQWSLVCMKKSIPSLITTIQMCGVFVGAFITGQLADMFGRKKVLFAEYALLLLFSLISAFMPSWQLYAVFRFIIGGLVGG